LLRSFANHVLTRDRVENCSFNGKHRSFGGPKIAAVVPQKFSAFSWGRTDFPRIWEVPEEPMPMIRNFGTESDHKTYPSVPRQDMGGARTAAAKANKELPALCTFDFLLLAPFAPTPLQHSNQIVPTCATSKRASKYDGWYNFVWVCHICHANQPRANHQTTRPPANQPANQGDQI
jgi:hypothetical protein